MDEPLRGRLRVQPAGTAWSPLRGVVGFGTDMWGRCSRPAFADNNPSPTRRFPRSPGGGQCDGRPAHPPRLSCTRGSRPGQSHESGHGGPGRVAVGCDNGRDGGTADPALRADGRARRRPRPRRARSRDGHLVFGPDLPAFEAGARGGRRGRRRGGHRPPAPRRCTSPLVTAGVGPGDEVWASRPHVHRLGRTRSATAGPASCSSTASRARWNLDPERGAWPRSTTARRGGRADAEGDRAGAHARPSGRPRARSSPLAAEHGITIVEDAAEALGLAWRGGDLDGRAPGTRRRLRHLLVQLQQAHLHRRRRDARRA